MTLTNRATRVKGQQPTWGWHEKCVRLGIETEWVRRDDTNGGAFE
jgi:hypothetical protein